MIFIQPDIQVVKWVPQRPSPTGASGIFVPAAPINLGIDLGQKSWTVGFCQTIEKLFVQYNVIGLISFGDN